MTVPLSHQWKPTFHVEPEGGGTRRAVFTARSIAKCLTPPLRHLRCGHLRCDTSAGFGEGALASPLRGVHYEVSDTFLGTPSWAVPLKRLRTRSTWNAERRSRRPVGAEVALSSHHATPRIQRH